MGIIWCDKPHDNLWYYYQNSSEGNEEPALLKTGLSSAIEISIILALKGWRVIATKRFSRITVSLLYSLLTFLPIRYEMTKCLPMRNLNWGLVLTY